MKLHTKPTDFRGLIEVTAKHFNLSSIYIEKDYWVTYLLKRLSNSQYGDVAIFKGGTSLSKAYKIIHRFSEDIDLAIISENLNSNQTKSLIKNIEKAILDKNFTECATSQTSKGSKFRKTVYEYPKIMEGLWGHAKEQLILELNSFAQPYPYVKKEISTYIYEFLDNQNDEVQSLIQRYGLQPFTVNILDYKRTLCEKISAIARASYNDNEDNTEIKSKIRHLYDIYFLMQQQDIQQFIKSNEFINMLNTVRSDDHEQFGANWTTVPFSDVQILHNPRNVLGKVKLFYDNEFRSLVYNYETMPTIDDIIASIELLSDILCGKA